MPALRENRQLLRAKRGVEPGQVFVRQQEIVLVDYNANVGIGVQGGVIRPQITRLFHRFPCRRGQAPGLIIRNGEVFKIILEGVAKNFLIHAVASETNKRVPQKALIVSPLTAVDNIPQHESKRQSDEKLGLNGTEWQRGSRRELLLAQGGHFQKSVFDVIGSFRSRPVQGRPVKGVQLGNPVQQSDGRVDGNVTIKS